MPTTVETTSMQEGELDAVYVNNIKCLHEDAGEAVYRDPAV